MALIPIWLNEVQFSLRYKHLTGHYGCLDNSRGPYKTIGAIRTLIGVCFGINSSAVGTL